MRASTSGGVLYVQVMTLIMQGIRLPNRKVLLQGVVLFLLRSVLAQWFHLLLRREMCLLMVPFLYLPVSIHSYL